MTNASKKVVGSTVHACAVPPPSYVTTVQHPQAVVSKNVWSFDTLTEVEGVQTVIIKYGFVKSLRSTQNRRDAVRNTVEKAKKYADFDTWEDWANVHFKFVDDFEIQTANIRVAFDAGSSWSAVGRNAENMKTDKPTLNLGWLADDPKPTANDRGTILHEFGHALGMMHEHQSPARGEYIHLRELEVYNYYLPLLGSREMVKSQIIDTYNRRDVMNLSHLDLKSIMMYFMPARLNEEGIDIPVNVELSKLDKAFIMLAYPPDLTESGDDASKERLRRFKNAMIDAGVTIKAAGQILDAFKHPNAVLDPNNTDSDEDATLSRRLSAARKSFSDYNARMMHLQSSNTDLLSTVDPASLTQFGIMDFLGDVVKNKLFQSVVKNVVKNTIEQRGIPMKQSLPGATPTEVANMIGALSMHDQVAHYVKAYQDDFKSM